MPTAPLIVEEWCLGVGCMISCLRRDPLTGMMTTTKLYAHDERYLFLINTSQYAKILTWQNLQSKMGSRQSHVDLLLMRI